MHEPSSKFAAGSKLFAVGDRTSALLTARAKSYHVAVSPLPDVRTDIEKPSLPRLPTARAKSYPRAGRAAHAGRGHGNLVLSCIVRVGVAKARTLNGVRHATADAST